jgi:nucleoside-diphosphate-sugar epimerase
MKTALVLGAGGFIGSHLVRRLRQEKYYVIGVDLKYPEYCPSIANEFIIGDLREKRIIENLITPLRHIDEVYQLAADMGGAGYVFSGEHDADIMYNSALINLNVVERAAKSKVKKLFFSSSACAYPSFNQTDPNNPNCAEDSMYPAQPDSEYGWEKVFSERLYSSYERNYGLNVRIARFHNIFGPEGAWNNGKEKAPAAICRKVAEAKDGDVIDIWGDGKQTRSFLYIDECLEGIRRLMEAEVAYEPLNIGSEEMVTINELAEMVIKISGKSLTIKHIDGPLGVRGRNSNNNRIYTRIGWKPDYPLEKGLEKTYLWIKTQVKHDR